MTGKQILLGKIIAAHGLKGEVKIRSFTADPLDIASYGMVTVPDGRRFHLERARMQGDLVIAAVRGIVDRDAAEALKGLELSIDREDLPDDEAGDGEFYQADLIGLPVYDGNGTRLGEVVGFQDFGAGDLMEVEMPSGTVGLVPFADSMVPFVDVDEGRIVLSDTGVAVLHADVELSEKKVGIQ
ncbi:MAG: ribosome maturation factor RimM [Alphaproteobacteria bacterium]|jgi:16S rRNA processing protein RimM